MLAFHGKEEDDEVIGELPGESIGHMCQYSELKMVIIRGNLIYKVIHIS